MRTDNTLGVVAIMPHRHIYVPKRGSKNGKDLIGHYDNGQPRTIAGYEKCRPEEAGRGAHSITDDQPPFTSSFDLENLNDGPMSSFDIRHDLLIDIECILGRLL